MLLSLSCDRVVPDAQSIVDRSIKAHGGELYENSIVEFDFRGRHYKFERNRGIFEYHRIFHDSAGVFHDVLDNSGFKRFLNEKEVSLDRDWVRRYSNSVNSVAYFSYLPFGLNDPAVNKKLIGEEEIEGNKYHKIRVTFAQEGGGEDFEDVFVYWINQENYQMDYLGYSYITDGGGIRFRKAINRRIENGLMYSDFINYRGASDFKDVPRLASLYKEGKLEVLSEISIENLEVKRFN
ncbi:MAG: hypothetical protein MI975_28135 [Cytophagales bacterium]|nr:hypothetical protein [Cytophagales bacterium]